MKIILKGNPLSTQHVYKITSRGKFASMYMSAVGVDRKKDYQWQCKSQWKGDPTTLPFEVDVRLFFGDKRTRDIDNYNKLILDAMSGIVYIDDSQIQALHIYKDYDKENPRIEILIIK